MTAPLHKSPLLSPDRALRVGFAWAPHDVWWGATWATVCGAAAAVPWPPLGGLVALAAVWFAAVVLLGAVWAPRLGAAPSVPGELARSAAGPPHDGSRLSAVDVWLPGAARQFGWRVAGFRGPSPAALQTAAAAALAMVLAWLLGLAVAALVLLGLVVAATFPRTGWRSSVGLRRTALEIVIPGAAAWFALGGPATVPVSISVFGLGGALQSWWSANWGFVAVLTAFAAVHHAATSVRSPSELAPRHRELALGYLAAILVLAILDRPLAAGLVAALFVGQWPFHAEFRAGRVRWHLTATQPIAMAAMLVATAGTTAS